jgi:hypothetical protein
MRRGERAAGRQPGLGSSLVRFVDLSGTTVFLEIIFSHDRLLVTGKDAHTLTPLAPLTLKREKMVALLQKQCWGKLE